MEFIIFVLVAANLTVTITLTTYVQRCMEALRELMKLQKSRTEGD